MVSRRDLAQANAVILTQPGHRNRTYTLGASEAVSFQDIATALAVIAGHDVPYQIVSKESFIARLVAAGFPLAAADFLHEWVMAVNLGEFAEVTGDLERLIGRRPNSLQDFIEGHYRESKAAG
jgi:NAD(P)H dehydrogenase (quinone)